MTTEQPDGGDLDRAGDPASPAAVDEAPTRYSPAQKLAIALGVAPSTTVVRPQPGPG